MDLFRIYAIHRHHQQLLNNLKITEIEEKYINAEIA